MPSASRCSMRMTVPRTPCFSFSEACGDCRMGSKMWECRKVMISDSLRPSCACMQSPLEKKILRVRTEQVFQPDGICLQLLCFSFLNLGCPNERVCGHRLEIILITGHRHVFRRMPLTDVSPIWFEVEAGVFIWHGISRTQVLAVVRFDDAEHQPRPSKVISGLERYHWPSIREPDRFSSFWIGNTPAEANLDPLSTSHPFVRNVVVPLLAVRPNIREGRSLREGDLRCGAC